MSNTQAGVANINTNTTPGPELDYFSCGNEAWCEPKNFLPAEGKTEKWRSIDTEPGKLAAYNSRDRGPKRCDGPP